MSALQNLLKSITHSLEIAGRARTLTHSQTLSDRTLDDLGFSRALMSQGVSAWPWKYTQDVSNHYQATQRQSIGSAVEELQAHNDQNPATLRTHAEVAQERAA